MFRQVSDLLTQANSESKSEVRNLVRFYHLAAIWQSDTHGRISRASGPLSICPAPQTDLRWKSSKFPGWFTNYSVIHPNNLCLKRGLTDQIPLFAGLEQARTQANFCNTNFCSAGCVGFGCLSIKQHDNLTTETRKVSPDLCSSGKYHQMQTFWKSKLSKAEPRSDLSNYRSKSNRKWIPNNVC